MFSSLRLKMNKKKEPNLIPMINIIFLLMIFFMLSGVVTKRDIVIIERPYSKNSTKINVEKFISFSILRDGIILLDNKEVSLNELENLLSMMAKDPKKTEVFLDIDKNVNIKIFDKLLEVIKGGNVERVFINTVVKNDN